jgi:predicted ATPase
MQPTNQNLIVITGGPGAGKTTLLHSLQARGYTCIPEAARQIIQEQLQAGGSALPWQDTTAYTSLMLDRSIFSFLQHQHAHLPTFFDRGIPDTLCYAHIIHLADRKAIEDACTRHRYATRIFLAPPWQTIYTNDAERRQTFAEAVSVFEEMHDVYRTYGYEPIVLPLTSPEDRAAFVLSKINCATVTT